MRTGTDVVRSLALYLSDSLGPSWEIRFEDEEGAFERPFCRIAVATRRRMTVQSPAVIDYRQTYSLTLYPAEKPTPAEARLEAEDTVDLLAVAFAIGTHAPSFGRAAHSGIPELAVRRGHPLRIPLWDFEGVGLMELPTERHERDFVKVDAPPEFGVVEGTTRNDEEETLYVVAGDVRCKWTVAGLLQEPAVVVEEIHQHPVHDD